MNKTTVYLPNELKAALARSARVRGTSEASVIRTAIEREVAAERIRPRGAIFSGGQDIADRVDEFLVGFGE